MKKKIMAVVAVIILIVGILVVLYLFVLPKILDPPPSKIMAKAVAAAQAYVNNLTDSNENRFTQYFSTRCRENLAREWRAQSLDGTARGSWFDIAKGLLNSDQTRPEILGEAAPPEGEEEEGAELQARVRIKIDRAEREIPFIRENNRWRIDIPSHPDPWIAAPPPPEK